MTTIIAHQRSAKPGHAAAIDVDAALEIVQTPLMDAPRHHEQMIARLLSDHPGYEQAFADLCAGHADLFQDVAGARAALDGSGGSINPFDGLRPDDQYLEDCLDEALQTVADALLAQAAANLTTALVKQWRAVPPAHARRVAA